MTMSSECDLLESAASSTSLQTPIELPSFELLGIRLHAMSRHDLVAVAARAVDSGSRVLIGNHNLHSLYLWGCEPGMRAFYSSTDYVNIDGMSLVLLGRLFGNRLKPEHRTNYIDLLPLLVEEAVRRQWRIFYLGSRPGVAEEAARRLRIQYPGLQIATRDGYFDSARDSEENRRVLTEIRDYAPDILMIGMGMPRQEIWVQENLEDLSGAAIFCCGGLMDLVAGEIPTPPRWIGTIGLEWLFRLFSQPKRTWRRYLLEPWIVLFRATRHRLRHGRWSLKIDANGNE